MRLTLPTIMVLLYLPSIHQIRQSIILRFPFLWWKTRHERFWFWYAYVFFTDIIDMQPLTIFKVSINDTVFEAKYEFTHQPQVTCLSDLEYNMECLPMADAAGLTLRKSFSAEAYVLQSNFVSNYKVSVGAVLVMFLNSVTQQPQSLIKERVSVGIILPSHSEVAYVPQTGLHQTVP